MKRRRLIGAAGAAALFARAGTATAAQAVEVDLTGIEPGGWRRVARGNWVAHVRRRTPAQVAALRAVAAPPIDPAEDRERAADPEWLVVLAECTHERCEPTPGVGAHGGWRCFCHGSEFDLAGRVLQGPAQHDLRTLAYRIDGTRMRIERGVDESPR
jgi:ubiquinol-cytochrome c reductase iron-sulfur subunit